MYGPKGKGEVKEEKKKEKGCDIVSIERNSVPVLLC